MAQATNHMLLEDQQRASAMSNAKLAYWVEASYRNGNGMTASERRSYQHEALKRLRWPDVYNAHLEDS